MMPANTHGATAAGLGDGYSNGLGVPEAETGAWDDEGDAGIGVDEGDAPVLSDAVPVIELVGTGVPVDVPVAGLDGDGDAEAPTEAEGDAVMDPDGEATTDDDTVGWGEGVMDADAPNDTDGGTDGEAEMVLVVDCDGPEVGVDVPVRVPERVMVGVPVCVAVDDTVGSAVAEGVGLVMSMSEHTPEPNVLLHDQPNGPLICGCGSGTSAGTSEHDVGNGELGMVQDAVQHVVSAVVGERSALLFSVADVHS